MRYQYHYYNIIYSNLTVWITCVLCTNMVQTYDISTTNRIFSSPPQYLSPHLFIIIHPMCLNLNDTGLHSYSFWSLSVWFCLCQIMSWGYSLPAVQIWLILVKSQIKKIMFFGFHGYACHIFVIFFVIWEKKHCESILIRATYLFILHTHKYTLYMSSDLKPLCQIHFLRLSILVKQHIRWASLG